MWNSRLQRIEAIVQGQQRMPAEGHDDRLLLDRQHGRARVLWTGWQIGCRVALFPFGDGLLVDPVPFCKRPQALLTMLYCSTDCLCRYGAAVKNLAHSASLHSRENIAPSKPGIKQLNIRLVGPSLLLRDRADWFASSRAEDPSPQPSPSKLALARLREMRGDLES